MNEDKKQHLRWMLDNFPETSNIPLVDGKHDRWLGFVQGALWAMDVETIDTFREDVKEGKGYDSLKIYLGKFI